MKNILKRMLILAIFLINHNSYAQFNHYAEQMQSTVGASKTDLGTQINAGMQYFLSDHSALYVGILHEWARPSQAFYKSIALDAGLNYTVMELGRSFYLNLKGYGSIAYSGIDDNNLIKVNAFNGGGKFGGGLEYFVTQAAAVELSGLQGFYLNKRLGSSSYEFGLTLKFNIK